MRSIGRNTGSADQALKLQATENRIEINSNTYVHTIDILNKIYDTKRRKRRRNNEKKKIVQSRITMNKTIVFFLIIFLWTIFHNGINCQTIRNSNRINRMRGNILRNLTRTHAYDDNIVTSQLDASERVRQFYRTVRNIYDR